MNTQDKLKEQNARNYGNARERVFTVRLTQEEADKLNAQVEQTGLSKGALIRATLANIQVREQNNKVTDDVLRELSAIGNNLNQLARAHHIAQEAGVSLSGLAQRLQTFQQVLEQVRDKL